MSDIYALKSTFNGGELSPMLDARVDSEKYAAGCKELTNFLPTVYGGIKKRPGTELVGFTKYDGPARLHSFKRSTDTNYILEFGAEYIRFWKGGKGPEFVDLGQASEVREWWGAETKIIWSPRDYTNGQVVLNRSQKYICIQGHTVSGPEPGIGPSWENYWRSISNGAAWSPQSYVRYNVVKHNNVIYMCNNTTSGGTEPGVSIGWELYWTSYENFVFEWPVLGRYYSKDDQVLYNGIVYRCLIDHSDPVAFYTPGESSELTPKWTPIEDFRIGDKTRYQNKIFSCIREHYPSQQFFDDEDNWSELSLGGGGEIILEIQTPYVGQELDALQFTQLNDVLFIAHPNHPPKRLSCFGESEWAFEDVPFQYAPALDVNEDRVTVQVQIDDIPPFIQLWAVSTYYDVGDFVSFLHSGVGKFFECIKEHTSGTTVESTSRPVTGSARATYWIERTGLPHYRVGDKVVAVDIANKENRYNGEIFTCHTAHNPGIEANDEPGHGSAWMNFWNFGTSSQKIPGWASGKEYFPGAKVRVGKAIYECLRQHKSSSPGIQTGGGGRYGVKVVYGSKPGTSKGWGRYWRISGADSDLSGLTLAMHASAPLFKPEDLDTIWQLELGTGGMMEYIAVPDNAGETTSNEENPLFIQGGYTVTTVWDTDKAMVGTLTIEESLNGVTWSVVRQFTQTSVKEPNIIYSGEAPSVGAWYRISATAHVAPSSPKRIKLEATNSVYKLPFKITKVESERKVEGVFIMPGNQLPPAIVIGVPTSVFRKPAFTPTNGFPRTVAFHDSRLWWGGTKTHPTRLWGSHVEDYYIYLGGELATDGLDLTLATVEANDIQWMTSFNRSLVIGTSGDEWTVDSGDLDGALTPANIRARRRTRYGSNGLAPQLTGDALLWVRRGGGRLHEFAYVYERDSFSAPDLTLLAEHLLHLGQVRQMAFVSCPDPVLWMVNGDYLLGLSYSREHNVTAWHKHQIPGAKLTSVAAAYGDHAVDEVWMVVHREDGPQTIERLHPETLAYHHGGRLAPSLIETFQPDAQTSFLDTCHVAEGTYDSSTNQTVFSGFKNLKAVLEDLDAQPQVILDGLESPGWLASQIDSAGNVTVSGQHGHLVMGLSPVAARMESMNLEVLLENTTSQGCHWRLIHVVPEVWRSRSFEITSGSVAREVVLPAETTGMLEEVHFSGHFDKSLSWAVESNGPHPCNLLGVVLKFEVTGG